MKLTEINTPKQLASLFRVPFTTFVSLIENPDYTEFTIPKKNGSYRNINAPTQHLLLIQKTLNYYLQKEYNKIIPPCVYGFVQNDFQINHRTVIENARVHINKPYVLNIDLKDFFTSIKSAMVRDALTKYIFSLEKTELTTCLTLLCTFNGSLPIGTPTSPVLSNIVALNLDDYLQKFALDNNCNYTRYADDLTFSLDSYPNEEFLKSLREIISGFGFKINDSKTRIQSKNFRQLVTGVKVNVKPNISRRYYRNVRAILHDIKINGILEAAKTHLKYKFKKEDDFSYDYYENEKEEKELIKKFISILVGRINWIGQVRGTNDFLYLKIRSSMIENTEWMWKCEEY